MPLGRIRSTPKEVKVSTIWKETAWPSTQREGSRD